MVSVLVLSGCSLKSNDNLTSFINYNKNKTSYELMGSMSIISNEDEFTYDINVGVSKGEYYKVDLINTVNDHEQVILKNKDGVYVVTPSLNKSFKFASSWPNNSSQAYLLERLVNDVEQDMDAKIEEKEYGYQILAKVNYPNNQKLETECITVDKDMNVKKVEVYNKDKKTLLTIEVNSIDYSPNFSKDYFNLDSLVTEQKNETDKKEEDKTCNKDNCDNEVGASNVLDDIIYPLYVPTNTYLKSKDTVSTDNGDRHILTFSGVDPFILVEEASVINNEMEVIPVNGEPLMLGSTIGAISDKSIYWSLSGVDYYLTSDTLDNNEMMTIAESITNSTSLVANTK